MAINRKGKYMDFNKMIDSLSQEDANKIRTESSVEHMEDVLVTVMKHQSNMRKKANENNDADADNIHTMQLFGNALTAMLVRSFNECLEADIEPELFINSLIDTVGAFVGATIPLAPSSPPPPKIKKEIDDFLKEKGLKNVNDILPVQLSTQFTHAISEVLQQQPTIREQLAALATDEASYAAYVIATSPLLMKTLEILDVTKDGALDDALFGAVAEAEAFKKSGGKIN